MIRKGKCANVSGCLLAYRGEEIMISTEDLACPECGKPLLPIREGSSSPVKTMLVAMGGLIVLVAAVLIIGGLIQFSRLKRSEPGASPTPALTEATPTPTPALTPIVREFPVTMVETTPAPVETPIPVMRAIPVNPADAPPPANQPPPTETRAEAAPDLDANSLANRTVKAEVLRRIDLMPTISADNKDKLYMSVERARQMGRMLVIPFESGRISLSPAGIESLRQALSAPQIKQLLQDPTAVFVILGFADTKGDEAKNLALSEERARQVLNTLRDKCGVANVMHSVGMGGSTLFDPAGTEKNRVAEVWAVLP